MYSSWKLTQIYTNITCKYIAKFIRPVLTAYTNRPLQSCDRISWKQQFNRVGIVGGWGRGPRSYLQTLISEWKSALNFNPWAKFQTIRQLTPTPVLLGQFQHCNSTTIRNSQHNWSFRRLFRVTALCTNSELLLSVIEWTVRCFVDNFLVHADQALGSCWAKSLVGICCIQWCGRPISRCHNRLDYDLGCWSTGYNSVAVNTDVACCAIINSTVWPQPSSLYLEGHGLAAWSATVGCAGMTARYDRGSLTRTEKLSTRNHDTKIWKKKLKTPIHGKSGPSRNSAKTDRAYHRRLLQVAGNIFNGWFRSTVTHRSTNHVV